MCTHPPSTGHAHPLSCEGGFSYFLASFLGDSGVLALYAFSSLQPANLCVCEKIPHELPEMGSLPVASFIWRLRAGGRLLTEPDCKAGLIVLVGGPTAMGQLLTVSSKV